MELDDLKSAWKSIPEQNNYKNDDIFKMMKKKSSSTIKWLFTFTLIEFIIVLLFTITSLIRREVSTNFSISINNSSIYHNYITGSIITIVFTLIFLIIIHKTYKKISINNSIKELTSQIIKFRKMVNLFILIILFSLIIVSIPYYFHLGQDIYLSKAGLNYDTNKATLIGYVSVLIAILFLIIISSIYYAIIYFFFLKKLSNNLNQLKEFNE